MTERWRKELEGIDDLGPSDEVYQRAKNGPNLPDPQSPMKRTSTRVVTAIAAFVVFALGISVFAIPALRLGRDDQFLSAGNQVQPLWPWNSIDAVKAWKDDPSPIGVTGSGDFAAPDSTAAAFGREVFGWTEVWAHEADSQQVNGCIVAAAYSGMSSPPPTGSGDPCSIVLPSQSMPPTLVPYTPTTVAPAFRTFDLSTCPPNAACDYAVGPPDVSVVVYQPLGSEGPWAVLEARNQYVALSLGSGTSLHDGSTIYASGVVPDQTHAILGYHASSSGCGETGTTGGFEAANHDAGSDLNRGLSFGTYSRGQLDLSLSGQDPACQHQIGYAFVVVTRDKVTTTDPLSGLPSDGGVVAFSAVPVGFAFPPAVETTSASPTATPTTGPTVTPGPTYASELGFTIDVPSDWGITDVTDELIVSAPGGDPYVQINRVPNDPLRDDSSFPLDYTAMANDPQAHFRGDGQAFIIQWLTGDGSAPTPEQAAEFDRITSSIAFPATTLGATEGGWTAVGPILQSASAEWVLDKLTGDHYLASLTNKGARVLFGPDPGCTNGSGSYEARETGAAEVVCPDGTGGDWDFTTGQPQPGSSAGFDVALIAHDVVRSWDGWLLARLGPTPSPAA